MRVCKKKYVPEAERIFDNPLRKPVDDKREGPHGPVGVFPIKPINE